MRNRANSADKNIRGAHIPVLLQEVIVGLHIQSKGLYIDGTFGRGGHTRALLQLLDDQGQLIAMDQDIAAIEQARALAAQDVRVRAIHCNFADAKEHIAPSSADGLLLDLGVSSPQLDTPERGFSFMHDGPLDMRMDQSRGVTAAEYLSTTPESELTRVLREYGEEPQAKRIANAIVAGRGSLISTKDLAELVISVKGRGKPGRHPATQVFQAIRMAVNAELVALQNGLQAGVDVLKVGARFAVISFHSLEDRVVKQFFNDRAKAPAASRRDFMHDSQFKPSLRIISKDRASEQECAANPRARSAVLRVVEKLQ
jgi:16S rRNA (cytosine1402-N4)-methyltransferase